MNPKQYIHLIQEGYTTIGVRYQQRPHASDPSYTFKCPLAWAERLKEGDHVVVPGKNVGYAVVVVAEVHDKPRIEVDADFDYKWVVQLVNPAMHERIVAKEKRLQEQIDAMRERLVRKQYLAALLEGADQKQISQFNLLTDTRTVPKVEGEG